MHSECVKVWCHTVKLLNIRDEKNKHTYGQSKL